MSENPLKQYFRRPAIYIQLPSGNKFYSSSDIDLPPDGELPVYPMSAIDEITSRTPDALNNGHAVTEIIKSCVPAIKNPWAINTIDMDAILIAIKIASAGDNMDIQSTCPNCGEDNKFEANMTSLLTTCKNVDYDTTLKIRELEIKFRPLTFQEINKNNMEQYKIQKLLIDVETTEDENERGKKTKIAVDYLSNLTTEIIALTIEYIKTPEIMVSDKAYIKDFLVNCDRQTNNAIKDYSLKLRQESELPPLNLKCVACSHEYTQSMVLNISDFFG